MKGFITVNKSTLIPTDIFDLRSLLKENVVQVLRKQGYVGSLELEVFVDEGTVSVEGNLPSYYLRQTAVACIKRVTGVQCVIDRITVRRTPR